MSYYVRSGISPTQIWKIDTDVAVRIGVSNPEHGPGSYFKAENGETIWAAIQRQAAAWFEPDGHNPFVECTLEPGQFYPRMVRPIDQHPFDPVGWSPSARSESHNLAVSRGQLLALSEQLAQICQTVHPVDRTLDTFGHDIRNLLILASTEAEAHWRSILIANDVQQSHYSTQHYVLLADAMKLYDFEVSFPQYPWLAPFKPFYGWRDTNSPTRDLPWYDAYNAAKHDREREFERATLRCAFEAVSACAVMLVAQFGQPAALGREFSSRLRICAVPTWPLSEVYVMPYDKPGGQWQPTNFPFKRRAQRNRKADDHYG
jgi:hypothetical protein